MGARIAADVFLAVAVLAAAVSSLGLFAGRDAWDRLHYPGVAAGIATWAVAAAVICRESSAQAVLKALLIALVLFSMSAILTHATARAIYHQRRRRRPRRGES